MLEGGTDAGRIRALEQAHKRRFTAVPRGKSAAQQTVGRENYVFILVNARRRSASVPIMSARVRAVPQAALRRGD